VSDPIVVADDACEILHRDDFAQHRSELFASLSEAGDGIADTVAEIASRGFLDRMVPNDPQWAPAMAALIAAAGASLPSLLAQLVGGGQYDKLCALLRRQNDALTALYQARPGYDAATLNAPAIAAARAGARAAAYDLLIVPGYTPLSAKTPQPVATVDVACQRLTAAMADLDGYRAPFVLVSGGSVHPPGTPVNEGLDMRAWLIAHGVPETRVLVDPFARHSTTNLRNAGRLMRALGMTRGLVVTGWDTPTFDQAFYFAHPILSTFAQRCRSELGYLVGSTSSVIDGHHVAFTPAAEVDTVDVRDPLDA
jgi:hypothetical protein